MATSYYESIHKFCTQIIPFMDDDKDFDSVKENVEQYAYFARLMLGRIEKGEIDNIEEFEAALTFFVETYFSTKLCVTLSDTFGVFRVIYKNFIIDTEVEQQLQKLGDE